MACYCSLAGTAACKNCMNNPNANLNQTFTYLTKIKTYPYTVQKEEESNEPITQYQCLKCRTILNKFDRYCHNCGSKIDWSDFED